MRGEASRQATMLTAITPDALIPQHHPIRRIKPMVDVRQEAHRLKVPDMEPGQEWAGG